MFSASIVVRWLGALVLCGAGALACRKPPPNPAAAATPSAGPAAAGSTTSPLSSVAPSASAEPAFTDDPGGPRDAGPDTSLLDDAGASPPPLLDDAGATLAQTEDKPSVDSAFFRQLGPQLWQAIVEDDADLVLAHFFPREAYREVKAIADPDRDWEARLVRHFTRDIHEYRMQLGKYRDEMQFVRIEVPTDRAKWMKPHTEGNKLGYWRVLRAQLVYLDRQQRERRLEITSMISWRGEWYVVHLHGFQ